MRFKLETSTNLLDNQNIENIYGSIWKVQTWITQNELRKSSEYLALKIIWEEN